MFVVCRDLCERLITGSEDSYLARSPVYVCVCVVVFDLENSTMRWSEFVYFATEKYNNDAGE